MTFQLVRSRSGKLRGIAILVGDGHIEAGRDKQTPWRICDHCVSREAFAFCTSCSVYVCEKDLPGHIVSGFCKFLSVTAARELSTAALTERKAKVLAWR